MATVIGEGFREDSPFVGRGAAYRCGLGVEEHDGGAHVLVAARQATTAGHVGTRAGHGLALRENQGRAAQEAHDADTNRRAVLGAEGVGSRHGIGGARG